MSKMARPRELRVIPVQVTGEIRPGDSLAATLLAALREQGLSLAGGDILVVKHKIVSKAEGQLVELDRIKPSAGSRSWARRYKVDARVTELALQQSIRVVRRKRGVLITETHHGLVCANSGVDVSNVDGGDHALLFPQDPGRSAARVHRGPEKRRKPFISV